jgi:hypothetical protein
MARDGSADMTLVFRVTALQRLADPTAAVADARTWSDRIGVVAGESSPSVSAYLDRAGLEADFTSAEGSVSTCLSVAHQQFSTERYVFVGADDGDEELARSLGWEYLDVTDAAKRAGWDAVDR